MKKFWNILAACLLGAGLLCMRIAVKEGRPYREAEIEHKVLQENVIIQQEKSSPFERKIDFHALKEINEDIAAWIYVPGTSIDYPVLIGKNDSEYLTRNFRGEKSAPGAIFGFADTSRDFADAHICLFGHNMRSAQMFGELKKYKIQEFAENHRKLYCYTPEGVVEYELFSVYECAKTDATFEHKMQGNSEEFFSLFDRMTEKNTVALENGADAGRALRADNKKIITLSCCSDYQRTVNRVTVHFLETQRE